MYAADLDTILAYLALSNPFNLVLTSCRILASGIDLVVLGMSVSKCKLVVPGISGNNWTCETSNIPDCLAF